jgi:hypothetical protein
LFDCAYWKQYQAQRVTESFAQFTVVLHERDAIWLGIDPRREWHHPDAGEQREYGVVFMRAASPERIAEIERELGC